MGGDASSDSIEKPAPASRAGAKAARALRPRDAATLVLVDDSGREPRVLMGRRRADLEFMPNKFVFPGGRVDRADRWIASADELAGSEIERVLKDMKGHASAARARSLALAALREAFEEAGIVLGTTAPAAYPAKPPRAGVWADFFATGAVPTLAPLSLLARAITPPGRARRYDTRFFMAPASAIATTVDKIDDELSGLEWFTFDEIRALDLPRITRAIVEDLAIRTTTALSGRCEVPFYFYHSGAFRRALL